MTLALRPTAVPESPVARWDARWKLAALLVASAGVATLRSPTLAAVALLAAIALAAVSRLPARAIAARLGLVGLAVLPVLVVVPLTLDNGTSAALGVAGRALAIGVFALVLARTAPPDRTFAAAHALRVPAALVQVAQLAHRYAFLFAAEGRRVRIALATRGFRMRTNAQTYRTLGHAVGGLLVRGGDRAERVAASMRCRGFDGTFRTATPFRTATADVLAFALVVAGTAALVIWDRVGRP